MYNYLYVLIIATHFWHSHSTETLQRKVVDSRSAEAKVFKEGFQ
jgi:hypothetical protein